MVGLSIRPLEPGDADRLVRMFDRLSPTTRYRRFFSIAPRLEGQLLRALVDVDHHDREALVAVADDEIVAVAHFARFRDDGECAEIAVVVEDGWQRRGLGRRLVRALAKSARDQGVKRVTATILADNVPALGLARAVDPSGTRRFDGSEVVVASSLAA